MVTWGGPERGITSADASAPDADGGGRGPPLADVREQLRRPTTDVTRDLPVSVTRACEGRTRRLELEGRDPTVAALDVDGRFQVTSETELPAGEFRLTVRQGDPAADPGSASTVTVQFEGPASVRPAGETVTVSFWDPTLVAIGVDDEAGAGPAHVTVPPTPEGIATAISHLPAAHRTTGPAHSHPDFRDHPPLVSLGDATHVPTEVRDRLPSSGITLRLPRSMDALFVAAPLAYYLGADVTVENRERPVLSATDADVEHVFDPLPAFQHQVSTLLRRTFYFDCQVRRVAPVERDATLRNEFDVDPRLVQSLGPAGRLERYLAVDDAEIDGALPEWHLSTYVAPEPARARCLPYLLDRLSLVYLPESSELDRSDLLDRTLSEALPTRGTQSAVDVVQPELGAGRLHAWLAPGTPIDAFKTTPRAYENRFGTREREHDRLQVAVVQNDDAMDAEQGPVESVYREGAANLPIDVTVHERLDCSALADVFASEQDFVHYIGHCDDAGLRCPDGNLAASDLERSRTRTFFLNACGSYEEGLSLVERGSVVGAATFRDVLDRQAARVGTTFARLLVHGFSFERALRLARRCIIMGKDYAVVGDGTYALLPSPRQPAVVWLEDADSDEFQASCEVLTASSNGERYDLPFDDSPALNGTTAEATLSRAQLRDALAGTSLPVVYDGDVHWSDELRDRL